MTDFSNPKITAPGSYDLPNSEYHSQICDAPSISSTGLRKIFLESPAHFWATSDLNPYREAEENRAPALDFGSAAHSLLLEGRLRMSEYAIAPFAGNYQKNEAGWTASDKRAWRDEQHAAGLVVVSHEDVQRIERMAEALRRHPLIRDGLFRGDIERSLFFKRDGYWLKARPDVVPADTVLADYKTAADASLRKIAGANIDNGYYIQIALAIDAIRETSGRMIEHAALVVQEKEPPFVVAVYTLSDHFINMGRAAYCKAFEIFRECYERNEWPAYADAELFVPEWLHTRFEQEGFV